MIPHFTKPFACSLLFCLLIFSSLPAQVPVFNNTAVEAQIQHGLQLMYNMDYEGANRIFSGIQEAHPEHPAPYFMKALNRWWQTYISINTDAYYDYIEEQLDLAIEKNKLIEKKEGFEQEYTFFAFMNYALLSRLHAYRNEYMAAMGSARKVIGPLKQSLKFVGKQAEFYMVAGIYHYYAATYADLYPIVKPFMYFFPDGDKEGGLKELELAASTESFAQIEAAFFLSYIYLDELPDVAKGLQVSRDLYKKFPRNTWFETDYARALLLNGQFEAGEKQIDRLIAAYESQAGHENRNINSLHSRHTTHLMIKVYHYKGYAALYGHKDFDQAIAYFSLSDKMATLALVEEDFYLAGNRYYQGVCYDNLEERGKAIVAYEQTLDMDDNYFYKDQAKENLKRPMMVE